VHLHGALKEAGVASACVYADDPSVIWVLGQSANAFALLTLEPSPVSARRGGIVCTDDTAVGAMAGAAHAFALLTVEPSPVSAWRRSSAYTDDTRFSKRLREALHSIVANTLSPHADAGLVVSNDSEVVGVLGVALNAVLKFADTLNADGVRDVRDTDDARVSRYMRESLNTIGREFACVALYAGDSRSIRTTRYGGSHFISFR
jgi:hypothetical protein